jgi:hypothetical protein
MTEVPDRLIFYFKSTILFKRSHSIPEQFFNSTCIDILRLGTIVHKRRCQAYKVCIFAVMIRWDDRIDVENK